MHSDYYELVKLLYPNITDNDFRLIDDGHSIKLTYWDSAFGAAPSMEWLEAQMIRLYRVQKKAEIKDELYIELETGKHGYTTLGLANNFKLDSGRNDLQNLQNLRDRLNRLNETGAAVRTYDNTFQPITIAELDVVIGELVDYVFTLYQRKWEVEAAIDAATSVEALEAISLFP